VPAMLTGEVTIVPDAGTNSLLIRSSASDFELIQAAVQQLDVRPLQVLIQVLIAEVRRDRSQAFGIAFGLDTIRVPDRLGVTGDATASNRGLDVGDFVIRLMTTGDIQVDATLRAAAGRGDVRIMSQPVLVAANNEQAQILVGSQRPFVQVSRSLPTDAPSRDQVVQYKDVGTQLNIHPTISADGYVMLDVTQEINAATTETAFDAPVISTRSVQTRLLVKDGQTAVLGGLTDEQRDNTRSGIPFLSNIPVIGWLFGSSVRRAVDTELFIFLTPRVIREDFDVDDAALQFLKRSDVIKK
jgi:general secretion pathway protein D